MPEKIVTSEDAKVPAIRLDVTNNEPEFVEFYIVADKAIDLLSVTLKEILLIPQAERGDKYAANWTAYLGTLMEEAAIAVQQLLVLDLLRAAVIMNRQVFEYGVRLAYSYSHPDKAEALMDSLEHRVWRESEQAPGFFAPEQRQRLQDNFKVWAEENLELDSQTTEGKFTPMAREILGPAFDRDFFLYYAIPSIIAHAKPHGIVDVLEVVEGGLVRHANSRTADALGEFSKLVFFLLHGARAMRIRFRLSMEPVREVNNLYGIAQGRKRTVEGRMTD